MAKAINRRSWHNSRMYVGRRRHASENDDMSDNESRLPEVVRLLVSEASPEANEMVRPHRLPLPDMPAPDERHVAAMRVNFGVLQEEAREEKLQEDVSAMLKLPSKNSTAGNETLAGANPGGKVGAGVVEMEVGKVEGRAQALLDSEPTKQDPLLSSLANEQELRMEVRS